MYIYEHNEKTKITQGEKMNLDYEYLFEMECDDYDEDGMELRLDDDGEVYNGKCRCGYCSECLE